MCCIHAGERQPGVTVDGGEDVAFSSIKVTHNGVEAEEETRLRFPCQFGDALLFPGTTTPLRCVAGSHRIRVQAMPGNYLLDLPGRDGFAVPFAVEDRQLHLRV